MPPVKKLATPNFEPYTVTPASSSSTSSHAQRGIEFRSRLTGLDAALFRIRHRANSRKSDRLKTLGKKESYLGACNRQQELLRQEVVNNTERELHDDEKEARRCWRELRISRGEEVSDEEEDGGYGSTEIDEDSLEEDGGSNMSYSEKSDEEVEGEGDSDEQSEPLSSSDDDETDNNEHWEDHCRPAIRQRLQLLAEKRKQDPSFRALLERHQLEDEKRQKERDAAWQQSTQEEMASMLAALEQRNSLRNAKRREIKRQREKEDDSPRPAKRGKGHE